MIGARLAGLPWGLIAAGRVALYRRGWLRRERLPRPTVSVGALEMGGTGKTPATAAVVRALQQLGRRPAILSRGYRRATEGPLLVSSGDGSGPCVDATAAGDEPWLLAHQLPDVAVAVAGPREQAAALVPDDFDMLVLDDGFQHVRVERDLDLLVVDAQKPFWRDCPPPFGRLREWPAAAARASALLALEPPTERRDWPAAPLLELRRQPGRLVRLADWHAHASEPSADPPRAFHAFAGIARPHRFVTDLAADGIDCRGFTSFGDHARFHASTIAALARQAPGGALLTTEKDAARLVHLDLEGVEIWVRTYRMALADPARLETLLSARLTEVTP